MTTDNDAPIPDNLKNNLGFLLNKAARIMRDEVAEGLKPLSLSFQEYVILRMIENHASETQQELAMRNGIDRTSMVDIVDRLEERELLVRHKDEHDRRKYQLLITPKGRKTLTHAKRITEKVQKKLLQPLSETELQTTKEALSKLIRTHTQLSNQ
jgi:DNA-binding MarR family transcriptional regulator